MKDTLRQQLERLALRVLELDALLADPQLSTDRARYRAVAREQSQAASVVTLYRSLQERERDLRQSRELVADPEMAELAKEDVATAQADVERERNDLSTCPTSGLPVSGLQRDVVLRWLHRVDSDAAIHLRAKCPDADRQ
jgi:peptide chain release factor 1